MRYLISLLIIIFCTAVYGQKRNGIIEYNRKSDWINIMSKLPFMTKEEIDRNRLTWGNREDNKGENYQLYFNEGKSIYIQKEEENEYGYSWRKDEYVIIRDYDEKTCHDQVDLLGKTYIIQEELPRIKWKILNEIKEIAGFLCMKAETIDPVKGTKIHAWFSDEINVYGGPEGYYGLPGMILGLVFNEDDVIIEATKVTFNDEPIELPIPSKMKGKQIARTEFEGKMKKFIDESIEGRKNPFWQIRY